MDLGLRDRVYLAEFGQAAAFVLSPAASYITGAMIPIDGGAIRSI
jgi:3-oxoacyl-[acyl-carrier protein] reductase